MEDAVNAALVCRDWNRLVSDPHFVETANLAPFYSQLNESVREFLIFFFFFFCCV